jgi:photosystem II stability/assembly factor-like uncharacterized protein
MWRFCATGQYQTAMVYNGTIYTSNNYGSSWVAQTTPAGNSAQWTSIAISATGKYQSAVVYNGTIYTSNNYGGSWVAQTTPAGNNAAWQCIAISAWVSTKALL